MAYHYTYFNDTPIPELRPTQDHSPARGQATIIPTLGGYYDHRGTRSARAQMQNIVARGTIAGETEYLTDETGDILVDENGDSLIAGNAIQMLRAQVDALAELVLERGTLWRRWQDDENVQQWKTARLADMSFQQNESDLFHAQLTLTFESKMTFWHAEDATTHSDSATSGTALTFSLYNAGQKSVSDPVLTIQNTSGTITSIVIANTTAGVALSWTGSLASGEILTLDCGDNEVPDDAEDAFDGLTMSVGHSAAGWIIVPTGPSDLVVTVTGGNATVTLDYYEQFV